MSHTKPVAIVGLGAIMPDAPNVPIFWQNIQSGRYSIREVTPQRWDASLYYDPDPAVPDKTYAKIGAIVTGFEFEPFKWGIAIPPRVLQQMDEAQHWAIEAARQALLDFGYPQRHLDIARTAVILGNALGGEKHYVSTLRIRAPEVAAALRQTPAFQALPATTQNALVAEMLAQFRAGTPEINEDTMPGELGNVIAGRVANVFNLQGPNFITDAACASSLAALQAAVEGLNDHQFDAALTGGVDRSMGVEGFVKFSKIGALSPDGSRPYADGANGFVMGEGAAIFLMKRLEDAEKDGDRIYAVIRGVGSSSDGKGKGITAPNPAGQQQAIQRAWKNAGVSPATVGLIEGHGTSTRVGDVVEVNSLEAVFGQFGLPVGSVALGSVKSNIGHLKSAAGAAGLLKTVLALHHKVLPPNANFERPNPNIEFDRIPFAVNTANRPWEVKAGAVRRAGVSSFGFGGANFHVVVDEYLPGVLQGEKPLFSGVELAPAAAPLPVVASAPAFANPYRGLLFLSAADAAELQQELTAATGRVRSGEIPPSVMPTADEIALQHRLAIDYDSPKELLKRMERAQKGFENPDAWFALTAHGVFHGEGQPGKVAFLFPGQGSQYVNMLKDFCRLEPAVQATFDEADRIMTPILGRPLTAYIYVDGDDSALAEAEAALRNTEITQPAMLTANVALMRLMERFGFQPDMVIGHSLGEYAALVAAGVLSFAEALQIVSARGREMKRVALEDNGCMAAVSAPIEQVEELLKQVQVNEYVVIANINSPTQCVIGGSTAGVEAALAAFQAAGLQGTKIPVSHAFHTRIVAPASLPLREVIARMDIQPARLPVVANVTGALYPDGKEAVLDLLAQQVASPVQFIKGVRTLYDQGGRVFVEVGPKRVLSALANDILKGQPGAAVFATNHPREGALISFNKALCGLLAAGVSPVASAATAAFAAANASAMPVPGIIAPASPTAVPASAPAASSAAVKDFVLQMVSQKTGYPVEMLDLELDLEADLGVDTVKQAELFAAIRTHYNILRREDLRLSDYNTLAKVVDFMTQALPGGTVEPAQPPLPVVSAPAAPTAALHLTTTSPAPSPVVSDGRQPLTGSVVVSGAGLGLPGRSSAVFDDHNVESILNGEIRIEQFPERLRQDMLEKRVTRLIKSEAGAVMQPLDRLDQTVKLGGQRGAFDLAADFGVPEERVGASDIATQLAIAAGMEALRDAGIPLVMSYRQTSKGTYLPDRWKLPQALRDETGVIFGSAFPGLDEMAEETGRYTQYRALSAQAAELNSLLANIPAGQSDLRQVVTCRIQELMAQLEELDYQFDRRFIFRILSMGHSQFAEYIGARGPNTHVNAACATTTHAVAVAEDWIRAGRARRVVVIAGDDVTSGPLAEWVGTGLMASGAATTEGDPRLAILPFDRRRNGMIMGMGAAALVLESEDAVRERGMRAICEVLASQIANSAFHGTRLDIEHVSDVMERLVTQAEQRFGIRRAEFASQTVFVSHETYTPARGGSAAAEIHALRQVFGGQADRVVIANTKGYTGHTMGVGVEDVMAVKALERGVVPPIANIQDGFEPDPDLGNLRLSTGGEYGVQYALRLGAGFGSQIAMTLLRKIAGAGERIDQARYQPWLTAVAGYDKAELEVVQRTLRVRHTGAPVRPPARSNWQQGQGPTLWTDQPAAPAISFAPPVAVQPAPNPVELQPMPAVAASQPATPTPAGNDDVKAFVLAAVSEKTGYPVEMLDLELDLEADLGIDTVKQ
ncbi:MAG: acyltransferase domain-containing protein, partial [Anaerolineae bacterium]|nr:acyltransferase domain-containing protein [Anaerolineae bacterium]